MPLTLTIHDGPSAGKVVIVQAGEVLHVGRHEDRNIKPSLALPEDGWLSNVHFALEWDGQTCLLRDLASRFGTSLNGARVSDTTVSDGDLIIAGRTTFRVHLDKSPPVRSTGSSSVAVPLAPATPARPTQSIASSNAQTLPNRLLSVLRSQREPLFALLDAARDPKVLECLRASNKEYQSLYEGLQGEVLADFAPYLVQLPAQSSFLETLACEGWGQSWGIYMSCAKSLEEIRKHFRHFLLVKLEGGKEYYFRFYDPRVLRVFLPTCTVQEAKDFFGPIRSYLLEAEDPRNLLQFTAGRQGVISEVVPL